MCNNNNMLYFGAFPMARNFHYLVFRIPYSSDLSPLVIFNIITHFLFAFLKFYTKLCLFPKDIYHSKWQERINCFWEINEISKEKTVLFNERIRVYNPLISFRSLNKKGFCISTGAQSIEGGNNCHFISKRVSVLIKLGFKFVEYSETSH